VHTRIEEEIFYPAFQRATGDAHRVEDGEREHHEAMDMVHRLEAQQVDDKLMLQLEDAVLHHINDEREKMFPKARTTPGMDLMRLADLLEGRKTELMAAAV
jgi:hypothetical protein